MQGAPVILVVDDEESVRLLLSTLLERDSYSVLLASDGQHALEVSRQYVGEISAIVTDYKMPRMNGVELIQRLRIVNPNVRVVLLSGFVEPLGLTEENTGADIVLAKSSHEPTQLVRSVKRLVNTRTLRKPVVSQKVRKRGSVVAR